jgi:hypothetical protein
MRLLVTGSISGRLGSNNYFEGNANEQISPLRVDYISIVEKSDPEIEMTTEETTEMNSQTDKELHSMPTIAERLMVRVR